MCQYANVPIGCAILPDGNRVLAYVHVGMWMHVRIDIDISTIDLT